jgi:phospholipase C
MPNLTDVSITFHTHNQGKDPDSVVHVFVKNRLNTTLGSDQNANFVSNLLDSQRYLDTGDLGDHSGGPYLAYRFGLGANQSFDDPSDHSFSLTLMPDPISVDDIVLPVVDVHVLTHGNNRWIFDYNVAFTFDDESSFSFSSKDDGGIPGVILDQDNRNYSGICAENPLVPAPAPAHPVSKSFLRKVTLDIFTHDDDKNDDTRLDVEIVNRLNATSTTAIAVGADLFPGAHFTDGGPVRTVHWPSDDGNLTLNEILLADMVLPEFNITIHPGQDRWIFDYRVTFEFADPDDFEEKRIIYSSQISGVILDQDNNKHSGVYQGSSFPAVAARPAPALVPNPDPITRTKPIPLALVRQKLDEFINNRNDSDTGHNPPLRRIRLHNSGKYDDGAFPESYVDVRSIVAGRETVNYVSSPTSLGQLNVRGITNTVYFVDVNSDALSISVDSAEPPIFTFKIHFETDGPEETAGLFDIDFMEFSITLKLTLAKSTTTSGQTVVDVLNWITELQELDATATSAGTDTVTGIPLLHYKGTLLGQPVDIISPATSAHSLFIEDLVHVELQTSETSDPGGFLRQSLRDNIFSTLTKQDPITGRTPRDGLNSTVTSWLLGGIADDDVDVDGHNTVITDITPQADSIVITYTVPQNVFVPETPADWPTSANPNPAWDFAPGTLSNIDHIVVLTMENRSFDHMLGYLSLPVAQGGMGRADIDGLTGGESNFFRGTPHPSVPVTDTFFSPFPPHGFEPVHRAINGGLMDGFAAEYAAQNGAAIAGQIMGHQTASTVPVYDALARDFAVGHRWFASHPGPTFCNRFYELTGRLNLDTRGFWEFDNSSPLRPVFTKTIFDYLSDVTDPATGKPEPVSWTYFEQGYCFLRFFERHTFDDEHVVSLDDQDRGFFALAQAGTLPSVSFIDPHFVELPPDTNDDDAPSDIKDGQAFVQRVVEAVVASPAWDKTLLVIVYDEHGGFYDHVPPSAAARVSPELPIDTHGVRVPAFVISPWVGGGAVFGSDAALVPPPAKQRNDLNFDHTSILRTIARRFMSADPPYLGARYAAANDLSAVVGTQLRQTQFRPFLRYNFQFGASQLMLGVKDADPAPGAPLWQLASDSSAAQDFSFEDAGDGFWYIRSHVSNLYLTVQVPDPVPAVGHEPVAAAGGVPPTVPQPVNPGVIQDVKFVAGTVPTGATTGLPAADRQKWRLRLVGSVTGESDLFLIESRAIPGKVLQPTARTQAGAVVLGLNVLVSTPPGPYAWKVNSPLLTS